MEKMLITTDCGQVLTVSQSVVACLEQAKELGVDFTNIFIDEQEYVINLSDF